MPAAQRGDRLAQIDRDILAPAGAQFPEIGSGETGGGEGRRTGRPDAERRRQHRIGAAGDLDRAAPLLGPAGDRQDRAQRVMCHVEISPASYRCLPRHRRIVDDGVERSRRKYR